MQETSSAGSGSGHGDLSKKGQAQSKSRTIGFPAVSRAHFPRSQGHTKDQRVG